MTYPIGTDGQNTYTDERIALSFSLKEALAHHNWEAANEIAKNILNKPIPLQYQVALNLCFSLLKNGKFSYLNTIMQIFHLSLNNRIKNPQDNNNQKIFDGVFNGALYCIEEQARKAKLDSIVKKLFSSKGVFCEDLKNIALSNSQIYEQVVDSKIFKRYIYDLMLGYSTERTKALSVLNRLYQDSRCVNTKSKINQILHTVSLIVRAEDFLPEHADLLSELIKALLNSEKVEEAVSFSKNIKANDLNKLIEELEKQIKKAFNWKLTNPEDNGAKERRIATNILFYIYSLQNINNTTKKECLSSVLTQVVNTFSSASNDVYHAFLEDFILPLMKISPTITKDILDICKTLRGNLRSDSLDKKEVIIDLIESRAEDSTIKTDEQQIKSLSEKVIKYLNTNQSKDISVAISIISYVFSSCISCHQERKQFLKDILEYIKNNFSSLSDENYRLLIHGLMNKITVPPNNALTSAYRTFSSIVSANLQIELQTKQILTTCLISILHQEWNL